MKKKVLLIGGDSATQNQLCQTLSDERIRVFAASNGASVTFQLCLVQPDLIILDQRELDSEEDISLCQIRERSTVPVIVLNAWDDAALRIEALDCGADLCLTKPLDLRELRARVGALLRRTQLSGRFGRLTGPIPVS